MGIVELKDGGGTLATKLWNLQRFEELCNIYSCLYCSSLTGI